MRFKKRERKMTSFNPIECIKKERKEKSTLFSSIEKKNQTRYLTPTSNKMSFYSNLHQAPSRFTNEA